MDKSTLGALPVRSLVADPGGVRFLVAARRHPGHDGITLVSDRLLALGCLDAREPLSAVVPHQDWGNNDYILSTLRQWLNSRGTGWYRAAHPWDAPPEAAGCHGGENPYVQKPGLLDAFSDDFVRALRETEVPTLDREGTLRHCRDRVFLLSCAEVGLAPADDPREGQLLPLFADPRFLSAVPTPEAAADSTWAPLALSPLSPWHWWLRTPYLTRWCRTRAVFSTGVLSSNYTACGSVGIRPAAVLDPAAPVYGPTAEGLFFLFRHP